MAGLNGFRSWCAAPRTNRRGVLPSGHGSRDHLSGLPISKISRRLCLADWRAAKAFSFKVGYSITEKISGWYSLLQNIMQVNHRVIQ